VYEKAAAIVAVAVRPENFTAQNENRQKNGKVLVKSRLGFPARLRPGLDVAVSAR
jgi:hypothetical protein